MKILYSFTFEKYYGKTDLHVYAGTNVELISWRYDKNTRSGISTKVIITNEDIEIEIDAGFIYDDLQQKQLVTRHSSLHKLNI